MTHGQMISAQSFREIVESGLDVSNRDLIVQVIRFHGPMCLGAAVQTLIDYRHPLGPNPHLETRMDEARRNEGSLRKTGNDSINPRTLMKAEEWAYVPDGPKRLYAMLQEREERLTRQIREWSQAEQKMNDVQAEVEEMKRKIEALNPQCELPL